jgi:hypothetical protein
MIQTNQQFSNSSSTGLKSISKTDTGGKISATTRKQPIHKTSNYFKSTIPDTKNLSDVTNT